MAASRQVDLLEPIDLAAHLDKIELYLGQVCQIAGISKMQFDYWTNKAQIPDQGEEAAHLRHRRAGDRDADQAGEGQGLNLGAAIEAAHRFQEEAARGSARAAPRGVMASPLECPGGVFGRECVDRPAGAELDAGEDAQAGDELHVPVARVVEPRVQRHCAGCSCLTRRIASARSASACAEPLAERVLLRVQPARPRTRKERARPTDRRATRPPRSTTTCQRSRSTGRCALRRRLREPHELRMRMRQAGARLAAFVHQRVQVAVGHGSASAAPRLARRARAVRREVRDRAERAPACGRDLLPRERGVQVVLRAREQFHRLSDLIALQTGTVGADVLGRTFPRGTIFDPATTRQTRRVRPIRLRVVATSGFVRDPFASNRIPAGRIDANAPSADKALSSGEPGRSEQQLCRESAQQRRHALVRYPGRLQLQRQRSLLRQLQLLQQSQDPAIAVRRRRGWRRVQ